MPEKLKYFALSYEGQVIAILEATDRQQAMEWSWHVRHYQVIPDGCIVFKIRKRTRLRGSFYPYETLKAWRDFEIEVEKCA